MLLVSYCIYCVEVVFIESIPLHLHVSMFKTFKLLYHWTLVKHSTIIITFLQVLVKVNIYTLSVCTLFTYFNWNLLDVSVESPNSCHEIVLLVKTSWIVSCCFILWMNALVLKYDSIMYVSFMHDNILYTSYLYITHITDVWVLTHSCFWNIVIISFIFLYKMTFNVSLYYIP